MSNFIGCDFGFSCTDAKQNSTFLVSSNTTSKCLTCNERIRRYSSVQYTDARDDVTEASVDAVIVFL